MLYHITFEVASSRTARELKSTILSELAKHVTSMSTIAIRELAEDEVDPSMGYPLGKPRGPEGPTHG